MPPIVGAAIAAANSLRGSGLYSGLTGYAAAATQFGNIFGQVNKEGVDSFKQLEKIYSQIRGITDLTKEDLEALVPQLKLISRETGTTLQDLAQAFFYINSGGLKGAEGIDTLRESAKLSAIGLGDINTLAKLTTTAIISYGRENLNAAQAADIFVSTIEKGVIETHELAEQMGDAIPFARALGVSLGEVGASFAAVTRTSTRPFIAATQIKNILKALAVPTGQTLSAFEKFGIDIHEFNTIVDNSGLLQTLRGLEVLLQEQTGSVEAARLQWRQFFPDVRAQSNVLDQLGESVKENVVIMKYITESTGIAERAWMDYVETVELAVNRYDAAVERLNTARGAAAAPGVRAGAERGEEIITDAARNLESLPESTIQEISAIEEEARASGAKATAFLSGLWTNISAFAGRVVLGSKVIRDFITSPISGDKRQEYLEEERLPTLIQRRDTLSHAIAAAGSSKFLPTQGPFPFGLGELRTVREAETRLNTILSKIAYIQELRGDSRGLNITLEDLQGENFLAGLTPDDYRASFTNVPVYDKRVIPAPVTRTPHTYSAPRYDPTAKDFYPPPVIPTTRVVEQSKAVQSALIPSKVSPSQDFDPYAGIHSTHYAEFLNKLIPTDVKLSELFDPYGAAHGLHYYEFLNTLIPSKDMINVPSFDPYGAEHGLHYREFLNALIPEKGAVYIPTFDPYGADHGAHYREFLNALIPEKDAVNIPTFDPYGAEHGLHYREFLSSLIPTPDVVNIPSFDPYGAEHGLHYREFLNALIPAKDTVNIPTFDPYGAEHGLYYREFLNALIPKASVINIPTFDPYGAEHGLHYTEFLNSLIPPPDVVNVPTFDPYGAEHGLHYTEFLNALIPEASVVNIPTFDPYGAEHGLHYTEFLNALIPEASVINIPTFDPYGAEHGLHYREFLNALIPEASVVNIPTFDPYGAEHGLHYREFLNALIPEASVINIPTFDPYGAEHGLHYKEFLNALIPAPDVINIPTFDPYGAEHGLHYREFLNALIPTADVINIPTFDPYGAEHGLHYVEFLNSLIPESSNVHISEFDPYGAEHGLHYVEFLNALIPDASQIKRPTFDPYGAEHGLHYRQFLDALTPTVTPTVTPKGVPDYYDPYGMAHGQHYQGIISYNPVIPSPGTQTTPGPYRASYDPYGSMHSSHYSDFLTSEGTEITTESKAISEGLDILGKGLVKFGQDVITGVDTATIGLSLMTSLINSVGSILLSEWGLKNIFGVKFAASGGFAVGRTVVGEKGAEIINLRQPQYVTSAAHSAMATGGGNNINIVVNADNPAANRQAAFEGIQAAVSMSQASSQENFGRPSPLRRALHG